MEAQGSSRRVSTLQPDQNPSSSFLEIIDWLAAGAMESCSLAEPAVVPVVPLHTQNFWAFF
jgi:hypothetical protein